MIWKQTINKVKLPYSSKQSNTKNNYFFEFGRKLGFRKIRKQEINKGRSINAPRKFTSESGVYKITSNSSAG